MRSHTISAKIFLSDVSDFENNILWASEYRNELPTVSSYGEKLIRVLEDLRSILFSAHFWTDEDIQFWFYEVGKLHYGEQELRTFFKHLYMLMYRSENGTRFGPIVRIMGVETFIDSLETALKEPLR